ncbi:MAG: hypothetical protein GY771_13435, partial [bacterium]|nr:hypothetical protein [bacterium]
MLNAKILNIILALSALCATNVFSASDDYLVESSLLQSQETNFWTYEIDDFNEVRIVYQIADSEKEAVSIGGTTDWSRSNGMDIVSRVDYDKYYINSIDPALYNILQRLTFGGAFLLEIDDIYSVYVGASGYTQGDNETLGKSGTFTASGRAAFGYEMGRLRIVGGAEITRDFGVRDYPSFYYEASDKLYLLPVGYINWEITDGVEINAGFPYNAVNLRPFDQLDICGAYDLRSDYSEVAVRVR